VTASHHFLLNENYKKVMETLVLTLIFAISFTFLQILEYFDATFDISDGIYGSIFFLATGFHGFHVIIGSIFLFISLLRTFYLHFNKNHHVGFEAAI